MTRLPIPIGRMQSDPHPIEKSEPIAGERQPVNLYNNDGELFFTLFRGWASAAESKIRSCHIDRLRAVEQALNLNYSIASHYVSAALHPNMPGANPRSKIIFSAYHRNLFALYSGIELTSRGLFGPARTVLRHVFESLIMAKYCSIAPTEDIYIKWESGQSIAFTNGVLNKIVRPDVSVFREFWSQLSKFVHATVYAQQMSLDEEHLKGNIEYNWDLILALIECHYHLLISHLATRSLRRFVDYTVHDHSDGAKEQLSHQKKAIQSLFSSARKNYIPPIRRLVGNYKLTREIRC